MIDARMVELELRQSRAIRLAAEAACYDVEELLEDIERSQHKWRRLGPAYVAKLAERVTLPLAA